MVHGIIVVPGVINSTVSKSRFGLEKARGKRRGRELNRKMGANIIMLEVISQRILSVVDESKVYNSVTRGYGGDQ